jgi:hypothetical protein
MSSQGYDNALRRTYKLSAVDFIGAAAVDLSAVGPKGLTGRVVAVETLVTTGVTVTASAVTVGPTGAPTVTLPVAISAIGAIDGAVDGDAVLGGQTLLAADTIFEIGNTGGSTAGVGDVNVTVDWF